MNRDSEIRDVLLDHSDHQPVRNVFGERTGQGSASIDDYVETIRIANRSLAVIASEGAAEVYAHWNDDQNRYEHLSLCPPWTITGYDHDDRPALVEYLEKKSNVRVIEYDSTPFADDQILSRLSNRIWI
jgi:hypothetical protein